MRTSILAILVLGGCGGSSPDVSPFRGDYRGTWEDYRGTSTFDLSVDSGGDSRWKLSDGRLAHGLIRSDGTCTLVIRYPRETLDGQPFSGELRYQVGQRPATLRFD